MADLFVETRIHNCHEALHLGPFDIHLENRDWLLHRSEETYKIDNLDINWTAAAVFVPLEK